MFLDDTSTRRSWFRKPWHWWSRDLGKPAVLVVVQPLTCRSRHNRSEQLSWTSFCRLVTLSFLTTAAEAIKPVVCFMQSQFPAHVDICLACSQQFSNWQKILKYTNTHTHTHETWCVKLVVKSLLYNLKFPLNFKEGKRREVKWKRGREEEYQSPPTDS